jgi:hypothetical protein
MSDLDRAAREWDRAQLEGRLNPPPTELDTRPRDALTNRPITFTPKATINRLAPWTGGEHTTISREPPPRNPFNR